MPVTVAPVSELIARELLRRLERLEDGYSVYSDVVQVIRPTRLGGFTPKHLQIVLTQSSPEIDEELSHPGNPPATAYRVTFNIRCHVMPSEDDIAAVDDIVNTLAADVTRVVCDETNWHTFAGNAVDAEWLAHENIDGDGSIDGVNVPLAVVFRTDETNPYNVRA